MDWKDWALIGAAVLILAGPLGVHLYHRGKRGATKNPQGESLTDDNRRLGTMVSLVGGRVIAEGAKLRKYGALSYQNDQAGMKMQKVGGA